jgi:hypothetical protein
VLILAAVIAMKRFKAEPRYFVPLCVEKSRRTEFPALKIVGENRVEKTILLDAYVSIVAHEVLKLETWYDALPDGFSRLQLDFEYSIVNNAQNAVGQVMGVTGSLNWCETIPRYISYTKPSLTPVKHIPEFIYKYEFESHLEQLTSFMVDGAWRTYQPVACLEGGTPFSDTLETINRLICDCLKLDFHSNQGLRYIVYISKNDPYEIGFDVLLICALLNALKSNVGLTECIASLRNLVQFVDCAIFRHTFNLLTCDQNNNALNHLLQDVFLDNPYAILQYITYHRRYNIRAEDVTITAITKLLRDSNGTSIIQMFQSVVFPFFYTCAGQVRGDVLMYKNGSYHYASKRLADEFAELMGISKVTLKYVYPKVDKIVNDYNSYLGRVKPLERPFRPGKYKYFINTKLGVFCTVTGTYMRKTPFLCFLDQVQERMYCVSPLEPSPLESLNDYCVRFQTEGRVGKISDAVDLMWFQHIYIPSVIEQSYGLVDLNKILICAHARIRDTRDFRDLFESWQFPSEIVQYVACRVMMIDWSKSRPFEQLLALLERIDMEETDVKCKDRLLAMAVLLIETRCVSYGVKFSPIQCALKYLAELNGWDSCATCESLAYFANLYRPFNDHKKFLLLLGESNTGKSTFVNYLTDWHGTSIFAVNSTVTLNDSSKPSPLLIKLATSYVACINEASELSSSLVKVLTGQDNLELRELFDQPKLIVPISFIMCVSNHHPKMDVDQAILNRITIFKFTSIFEDSDEDNLTLFLRGATSKEAISLDMGRALANLLFLVSKTVSPNRDLKNAASILARREFQAQNRARGKSRGQTSLKFKS